MQERTEYSRSIPSAQIRLDSGGGGGDDLLTPGGENRGVGRGKAWNRYALASLFGGVFVRRHSRTAPAVSRAAVPHRRVRVPRDAGLGRVVVDHARDARSPRREEVPRRLVGVAAMAVAVALGEGYAQLLRVEETGEAVPRLPAVARGNVEILRDARREDLGREAGHARGTELLNRQGV